MSYTALQELKRPTQKQTITTIARRAETSTAVASPIADYTASGSKTVSIASTDERDALKKDAATTSYRHMRPHKQLAKILRHLRDELHKQQPQQALPSSWMIRCLVNCYYRSQQNHPQETVTSHNNHRTLADFLIQTEALTYRATDIAEYFVELDGKTSLFPNTELFGPQHVREFTRTALQQLDIKTNHSQ